MWELDHKEGWMTNNWCFWTVVLEKNLKSPLDWEEIRPVNPKGNQSCIFMEGLMLKLKLQYFGDLMQRADSLEKTLMLEKTEGRRRRGWQRTRWLDGISGHEFEKTLGDGEGQGSLACCSPWVAKSHTWLTNWTTTWIKYLTKIHSYLKALERYQGGEHL